MFEDLGSIPSNAGKHSDGRPVDIPESDGLNPLKIGEALRQ